MVTPPASVADVPARPWLSADAERWAAVSTSRWAFGGGPAAALLLALVLAIAASPDTACTAAAPCGADWVDAAGTMLFLPHIVWLMALPEAAAVSSPLLLLWMAEPGSWQGGVLAKLGSAAVVAALVWGWLAALARLRARRRQQAYARDAAGGVAAPVPHAAGPRTLRGLKRTAAGVVVCAAAGVLIGQVVLADRADDRWVRSAERVTASVVAYDADDFTVTLRLPDGARHRIGVQGTYAKGARQPVLVKGDTVRLAAEPYGDPSGRQLLGLLAAGLGVSLLCSGTLRLRAAVRLRPGATAPVMRVLARRIGNRTEVFAADDTAATRPLLAFRPRGSGRPQLRLALLYGTPCDGGEAVLATATEFGQWEIDAAAALVRPVTAGERARPSDSAAHRKIAEARVEVALATMAPATGPVRWRGGPAGRTAGLLLALCVAGLMAGLAADGVEWWRWPVWLLGGAWWASHGLRAFRWRIDADHTGLRVRGLLRTRSVAWGDVTRVVHTVSGELLIRTRSGLDDIRVGVLGWPWLERRLGVDSVPSRAAAELTAMAREPRLRPVKPL